MSPRSGRAGRLLVAGGLVAAALAATVPTAFGFSGGMHSEAPGFPADFEALGCASCHGGSNHDFAPAPLQVSYAILDAEGTAVTNGAYQHGETYTINITLSDEQVPEAANHAGFYLRASAGEIQEGDGYQVTGGSTEASHTDASHTSWSVSWTAPESGAVSFMLLVNDVDGNASPEPTADTRDHVYRLYFALSDEEGSQLGASAEEEAHVGVELQQYWIGLIAIAGMLFIMLLTFVYIKWMNPHHTDTKDR